VIELASAGTLIWRLTVELRRGQALSENAERLASRIAGGLLFALAVYVTIAALWSLWTGQGEALSWPGLIVALAAIPSMHYLARRKIAIADKIGSRALMADAMEAVTCGWLSAVVVVMRLSLAPLNLIVWAKTNGGMGGLYRSQHELLPLFKKGRPRTSTTSNSESVCAGARTSGLILEPRRLAPTRGEASRITRQSSRPPCLRTRCLRSPIGVTS